MFKRLTTVLSLLSLGVSLPVVSAPVHLPGETVDFYYDDTTLFGTANVIGNSIFFLPTKFKAESLNGTGAASTNVSLKLTITATDGNAVERIMMQEYGDYKLSGTDSSARVNGMLQVVSETKSIPPLSLFPYTDQPIFDTGELPNTGGSLQQWSASAEVDLGTIPGWLNDTSVSVTAENLLTATTFNLGEQAFVEKKFMGIGVIVNPVTPQVPVPAAVWLFGSGLIGLAGFARYRRKH